jgi:hypothetical protein
VHMSAYEHSMAGHNHELSSSELKQVIAFSQTEHAVMCGAEAEDKVEAKAVKDGLLDANETVNEIKGNLPASVDGLIREGEEDGDGEGDVHSGGDKNGSGVNGGGGGSDKVEGSDGDSNGGLAVAEKTVLLVASLEASKAKAVAKEDYDRAKELKEQIATVKAAANVTRAAPQQRRRRRMEAEALPTTTEALGYSSPARKKEMRKKVVGVVPYYSGQSGDHSKTGNAHSTSPAEVKLMWVMATVCSMLNWMAHVLVGVCNDSDKKRLEDALSALERQHVRLCGRPTCRLIRQHAQFRSFMHSHLALALTSRSRSPR